MKKIGLFMLIGLSFSCKKYFTFEESVGLKEFQPLSGVHCESSALLNALNHQGYNLSEEEILGAGAVVGFIFQKGSFPFIGGRTLKLKENLFSNLGITWHQGEVSDKSLGWDKIHKLLGNDTPVVLRVDMRYLPYMYNGKYGPKYMSFGWHVITLVSMDMERGVAYVTDTTYQGLQEIKLKDLHKARFSKLKVMPPEGQFYWVEKAPEDFAVNWEEVVKKSLNIIHTDMLEIYDSENELVGLKGMGELSEVLGKLNETTPSYLMEPVLNSLYGFIEHYGTGGAAFRDPYLAFLESKSELNPDFIKYSELLSSSVLAWDKLSACLKEMAENKENRDFKKLSDLANKVYLAEQEFITSIN